MAYPSLFCSRQNWPVHRACCRQLREAGGPPSRYQEANPPVVSIPGAAVDLVDVLALVFQPTDGMCSVRRGSLNLTYTRRRLLTDKYHFELVACPARLSLWSPGRPSVQLSQYFEDGCVDEIVLALGLNGSHLRFPYSIWFCPRSLRQGWPENRAIKNLLGTEAPWQRAWCGTVVVLKYCGTRRRGYRDMSPTDLPSIAQYFRSYK